MIVPRAGSASPVSVVYFFATSSPVVMAVSLDRLTEYIVSMPWSEFLQDLLSRYPSPVAFAHEWWHYNAPLIERIRALVPAGSRLLEVGPGTGAISVLLSSYGYEVVGIDLDPEVVAGATSFAEHFHASCKFEIGDGFDLSAYANQFDLAFSCGVIEHFETSDAAKLLVQQARAARMVLTVVPTTYALRNDPLTGPSNARPMTLRHVKSLFTQAQLAVVQSFGYGTPDDAFAGVYRYWLPRVVQWPLSNKLSYACSVGCFGRPLKPGTN